MINRLLIYLSEIFHPFTRFLYSLALTYFIQTFSSGEMTLQSLIIGTLTTYFILLIYRVTDEFKDYQIDLKYFPDRPLPSGRVKKKDLIILLCTAVGLTIVINLFQIATYPIFIFLLLYCAVMAKWFFLEKWLSKNRILAFITHAPISIVIALYCLAITTTQSEVALHTVRHWTLIGILVIPSFMWEILRKSLHPSEEREGYQAYSSIIGYRPCLFIGIIFIIAQAVLIQSLIWPTVVLVAAQSLNLLFLLYLAVLFISGKKSLLPFRDITEGYTTLIMLILLATKLF